MADEIVIRINAVQRFTREEVEQHLGSGPLAEALWREMKAIAADDGVSLYGLEQDILGSLCYDAEEAVVRQADRERQATAMAKWEAEVQLGAGPLMEELRREMKAMRPTTTSACAASSTASRRRRRAR